VERRLSWLFDLDSYMVARMSPTWHKGRLKAWDSEENLPIAKEWLPYYICPANPEKGNDDAPALTHCVGITGLGSAAADLPKADPKAAKAGRR
jgi:hypothetical protein